MSKERHPRVYWLATSFGNFNGNFGRQDDGQEQGRTPAAFTQSRGARRPRRLALCQSNAQPRGGDPRVVEARIERASAVVGSKAEITRLWRSRPTGQRSKWQWQWAEFHEKRLIGAPTGSLMRGARLPVAVFAVIAPRLFERGPFRRGAPSHRHLQHALASAMTRAQAGSIAYSWCRGRYFSRHFRGPRRRRPAERPGRRRRSGSDCFLRETRATARAPRRR